MHTSCPLILYRNIFEKATGHDIVRKAMPRVFIKKLIIHIPDPHFRNIRYYGFYSNASRKELDHIHELLGIRKHKDYSRKTRQQKRQRKMNKLRYRTHLIDSFNRDPLKCRCGHYMKYEYTYDPLERCGHYMKYEYTYDPLEGRHNDRTYRKECIDEMQGLQIRRAGP